MVENPLAAQSRKIHARIEERDRCCGDWRKFVVIGHRANKIRSVEIGIHEKHC